MRSTEAEMGGTGGTERGRGREVRRVGDQKSKGPLF